jgi:ATP:ADP antiporter, AAA family
MERISDARFGTIRSYVWPIFSYELRKIIPMLVMMFCVCFNYSILRNLKDSILITGNASGAAVLPFIKVWAILPGAIIATVLFTYLSNHYSQKRVFQTILGTFIVFFALFAFYLFPNHTWLQPDASADLLEAALPHGCKALIEMYRHWVLTCFYVMSELWGTITLGVLFWGFANHVTKIQEAPRYYSVLGIASNTAAIIAGQVGAATTSKIVDPNFFFGVTAGEQSLIKLLTIIIISAFIMLISYSWLHKNVLTDAEKGVEENSDMFQKQLSKKKKLGFFQSLGYIARSKYLLCIAVLLLSYNLVIGLVEVIWKEELRAYHPNFQDYNIYLNNLTSVMGIISTTTSLLMMGILSRLGWTRTALITPFILLATSIPFFACILGDKTLAPIVSTLFGVTPLALAVFLGSLQNCCSKAAKYSVFDTTKEMAFIPLPPEHKLKGKAAIDGIGSRLGKSGSSCIHQGLYFIFCSLAASTPYVALVLLVVIGIWIAAVFSLGIQFDEAKGSDGIEETSNVQTQIAQEPIASVAS